MATSPPLDHTKTGDSNQLDRLNSQLTDVDILLGDQQAKMISKASAWMNTQNSNAVASVAANYNANAKTKQQ